mgnify:CR=1 FL=1
MNSLQRRLRPLVVILARLVVVIVVLTLFTVLFERIVPWERLPWGGLEARGTIVAHDPISPGSNMVRPTVIFTTETDEIRFVERRAVRYPIGAEVSVLYNPDDPRRARIGSHRDLSYIAAVAVGVVLAATAAIVNASGVLRRRRGPW